MNIGRKIYYEKSSGVVIWDKGELSGEVFETTFDQDCIIMPVLKMIDPTKLGVCQLQFGELQAEFLNSAGYIIDTVTAKPKFVPKT